MGGYVNIIKATKARSRLYSLIDETNASHQLIVITGKRNNAVLVSEEDWNAINETLYLPSILGMRESIREGLKANLDDCSTKFDW
jgi:antitoxin YefM